MLVRRKWDILKYIKKKKKKKKKNRPSVEEIRCWGDSFDRLMKSSMGRVVFREFLKCEYSEENILFWLACEDLKKDNTPEVVEEKARLIYEDYISILSPKEVLIAIGLSDKK